MQVATLKEEQLEPGDALLCYSSDFEGKYEELKNGYSYAEINTRNNGVFESFSTDVKTTNISSLPNEYEHIAILINKELWSAERLSKLKKYSSEQLGKNSIPLGCMRFRK